MIIILTNMITIISVLIRFAMEIDDQAIILRMVNYITLGCWMQKEDCLSIYL